MVLKALKKFLSIETGLFFFFHQMHGPKTVQNARSHKNSRFPALGRIVRLPFLCKGSENQVAYSVPEVSCTFEPCSPLQSRLGAQHRPKGHWAALPGVSKSLLLGHLVWGLRPGLGAPPPPPGPHETDSLGRVANSRQHSVLVEVELIESGIGSGSCWFVQDLTSWPMNDQGPSDGDEGASRGARARFGGGGGGVCVTRSRRGQPIVQGRGVTPITACQTWLWEQGGGALAAHPLPCLSPRSPPPPSLSPAHHQHPPPLCYRVDGRCWLFTATHSCVLAADVTTELTATRGPTMVCG